MDFKVTLVQALEKCGDNAKDSILLYNMLWDMIGNDFELKSQLEKFHSINKQFSLVDKISENSESRIIGMLLKDCEQQTDVTKNICLKWIYTIFEFYYQKKHKGKGDTAKYMQELQCIASDFPELNMEEREAFKLKKQKKKTTPKKAVGDKQKPLITAPQKQPYAPILNIPSPPRKNSVSLSSLVIPQSNGKAPYIRGLKVLRPFVVPNSTYKMYPDDVTVYRGTTAHLHTTYLCPSLFYAGTIYKGLYSKARYEDFFRMYGFFDNKLSEYHISPICKICANIPPRKPGQTLTLKFSPL